MNSMLRYAGTGALALSLTVSAGLSLDLTAQGRVALGQRNNQFNVMTSGGRPSLLIPASSMMQVDGTRTVAHRKTLAFADEGTWYVVRNDDPQQFHFLTIACPAFKGMDVPASSVRMPKGC